VPDTGAEPDRPIPEGVRRTLDQLCRRVAQTFHALEVSVFLVNPAVDSRKFYLAGTTWHKTMPYQWRSTDPLEQGVTNWVLRNQKPVIIFDWTTGIQDQHFLQTEYRGLVWTDRIGIIEEACRVLGVPSPQELPSLSEISTPVFVSSELAGVIRCSAGRFDVRSAGPWYYNLDDLRLLELVAAAVARYWGFFLHQGRIIAAQEQWRARAFTDLRHQLKGPLDQLHIWTDGLLAEDDLADPDLQKRLQIIRGVARKGVRDRFGGREERGRGTIGWGGSL